MKDGRTARRASGSGRRARGDEDEHDEQRPFGLTLSIASLPLIHHQAESFFGDVHRSHDFGEQNKPDDDDRNEDDCEQDGLDELPATIAAGVGFKGGLKFMGVHWSVSATGWASGSGW